MSLCDWLVLHLNIDWKGSQIRWQLDQIQVQCLDLSLFLKYSLQVISLAQDTCVLLLEIVPFEFHDPCIWQHKLPGDINRADGYKEPWLLLIDWFRKYANCSRFFHFFRVNSSRSWQDKSNSKRHPRERSVCYIASEADAMKWSWEKEAGRGVDWGETSGKRGGGGEGMQRKKKMHIVWWR